jgi:ubiquinone/menaquinone biosynthesis C-methylase UbiE
LDYREYYEEINNLAGNGKSQARTRATSTTVTPLVAQALELIDPEIEKGFCEYASPMPPLLEGATVAVLCCGNGRDAFVASKLVGPNGYVIGIDPVADNIKVANSMVDRQMEAFGYDKANIEFLNEEPEDLSVLKNKSVDVVVSNCTFNLSKDKDSYVKEVQRVLKDGGEWYFTDTFTDRRISDELVQSDGLRAIRLAGSMYINDFRRLVQANGFLDPRYLMTFKTPMTVEEASAFPDIAFATITARLVNTSFVEDVCESYGETVTYKGGLEDYPDYFLFDKDIKFPTGKQCTVCGNVSGLVRASRYGKAFTISGNRKKHLGDTHGDKIIKCAPAYDEAE